MIKKIKKMLWNYHFNREMLKTQRHRKPTNLIAAKSVGLLFKISAEEDYHAVKAYVKTLQNQGKAVKVLGFTMQKEVPHYCEPKLYYDFFSSRQVNWYGKPKKLVKGFITQDFDMLISLVKEKIPALQYIAGLSRAGFKAGAYSEENRHIYDMMIQVDEGTSLPEYIEHLSHYLSMVNNKNNA